MELTAARTPAALARPRWLPARLDPSGIAAWTLAFSVVFYLALKNGGYDTIVRSQVGMAVWWVVLVGALSGVLPVRFGRAGWAAIGLLSALALWTGVAAAWSESAERSVVELGRVTTYLGVLVLALALQVRTAARHTINGVACAIGAVALLAVLSRLQPQWFPTNHHMEFLGPGSARKLSYPLNYWNALAAFVAMGVPLLLATAAAARTLLGQALATAALPVSALCIYLTISRGGALALVVGVAVYMLTTPWKREAAGTLLVAAIGSAIVVAGASQRDALQDGLATSAARHEGTELLWLVGIVCAGVALLAVAMGLAARHLESPKRLSPGRRTKVMAAAAAVAAAVSLGLVVGAPGFVGDRWQEFKAPVGVAVAGDEDNVFSRLQGANSNGRFQYWQASLDAYASDPWRGIGPGSFELWWARHGSSPSFVRDAHSLYLETLAEAGIVGAAVLFGLLALVLAAAARRLLSAGASERLWAAAAAGGVVAFMTAAALEWVWEVAAPACAVVALGAVLVARRGDEARAARSEPPRPRLPRVAIALLSVLAVGAIGVPMAGALAQEHSRRDAVAGRVVGALESLRTAQRLEPYAATPHLRRALLLEQLGRLSPARASAAAAARDEPTNWRTWLVMARIDAKRGDAAAALAAFRRARRLNRSSPLLGAR